MTGTVLLLSGGVDSAAIAALRRPAHCLFISYGQVQAAAEARASQAIAESLRLPWAELTVDLRPLGSGLMRPEACTIPVSPSPEWWPFRNQFLLTMAAAWAVTHGFGEVAIGTVAGDGDRHADGTVQFVDAMDVVTRCQEGGVRIVAPAIHESAVALLSASPIDDVTLSLTHSCHRGDLACGRCPGCVKRREVLWTANRLQ